MKKKKNILGNLGTVAYIFNPRVGQKDFSEFKVGLIYEVLATRAT